LDHPTSPSLSLQLPHKMKVNSADVDSTINNDFNNAINNADDSHMFGQILCAHGTSLFLPGFGWHKSCFARVLVAQVLSCQSLSGTSRVLPGWLVLGVMVYTCDTHTQNSDIVILRRKPQT